MSITSLVSQLTDDDLRSRVRGLAAGERRATAELVAHLAELDARKLYLADGHTSMHAYCEKELGLTDAEGYLRIEAARLGRRFPLVLEMLADGNTTLTTLKLLGPHLTPENHRTLLDEARGKRKYQVEEMVARLAPRPDIPPTVRRLAAPTPTPARVPAAPRAVVTAHLAPERYALHATIDREVRDLMDLARDLLSHASPFADANELLKAAFEALVEKELKRKLPTGQPGARPTGPDSRQIPAAVRRQVYVRDHGRCAFKGAGGRVCGSRAFVEFHHVRAWMAGGASTVDNLELRCGPHNRHEAEVFFASSRQATRSGTSPAC